MYSDVKYNEIARNDGYRKEKLIQNIIKQLFGDTVTEFTDKKVIVKGCGNIKLSESLYIAITNKLQNIVKFFE